MNTHWKERLQTLGVEIRDNRVTNFGHPQAELEAARTGTVLCDLSYLGVIRLEGEDTSAFLQGQLSCDMRKVTPTGAQYGSYCTPKGRMLAVLLLWQSSEAYFLQLPRALREPIQKRLSMFVLRSKVKISDGSDTSVRLGLAGPQAEAALGGILGVLPLRPLGVAAADGVSVIRLNAARFEIIAAPERARALWDALASRATPAGAAVWDWLEIRAGIPAVFPSTQDQFLPQMANLDLIGGVSFQKGCYPGQEIIARTHYLGKLKRRMFHAHVSGNAAPAPGDELFSPDTEEHSTGMVVNAAPAPGGGFDLLAVVQTTSVEAGEVRWQSPDGPRLAFEPLPYPLES